MRNQIICAAILSIAILSGSALAEEWTTPVLVESGINTEFAEFTPFLSYDGLSLYFSRGYADTHSNFRIYEAKRGQPSGDFTSVSQVFSTSGHACGPWVSPDNLRMYYHQESGAWRIKVSQRASVSDPWPEGTTINLGSVSNPARPSLSSDELTMAFCVHASGSSNWDLFIATRPDINSPFDNIRSLTELNTAGYEHFPSLSSDALSIYWGNLDQIFKATRSSTSDPFGNVQALSDLDMPDWANSTPAISSDGTAIYFASGPSDIYVSYLVTVLPMKVFPRIINLKSHGQMMMAIVWMGNTLRAEDVDISSLRLLETVSPSMVTINLVENLMWIRFDLADVQSLLTAGMVEITLSGEMQDGTLIEATDTVRVINPGRGK